jgi:hypothetical protein
MENFGSGINNPDPQHWSIHILCKCARQVVNRLPDIISGYLRVYIYHPVTKYMHPLKEKAKYLEVRSKKKYLYSIK